MKSIEVLAPFHLKATNKVYRIGDVIEVTDDQFASIQKLGKNMVKFLAEVEEKPKKTRKTKQ